ncbi:MAG: D-aminoacylase [Gemmatimonadota bacterium]|nr:D-aminoacylase [Gemmatimonadota bacterium]MDH5199034.1 D-aminoacylase [Gemmatimonadota bacterium]
MTDRRTFVGATAGLVAGLAGGAPSLSILVRPGRRRVSADLLLRGALVYDGSGSPPVQADVAVAGDRIEAVSRSLDAPGAQVLDLTDLALAPGFIDIHSHTDLGLAVDPSAASKIRQGVTTEVTGQDGDSIGPWREDEARATRERYASRYGVDFDFADLGGFFRWLVRNPPGINLASMVGAGSVRGYVIGNDDRRATAEELDRMVALVANALRDGACGVSSGLEYVPSAFADLAELVALSRPLQGTGLPYASHMRNEDDRVVAAVEEALNVGRLAGVPVQISHLKAQGQRNWWKAEPVLHLLEAARADGIDVMYDRYPYVAFSTGLSNLFPIWARDGGTDRFLERLDDSEVAPRIEEAVRAKIAQLGSWDAVQVTSTSAPELAWAEGQRLGALAQARGMEPYALLLQLVRGDRARSGMVGFGMSEENTTRFLAHPLGMVCSDGSALSADGPLSEGTPHPRNFGTFPRVLGHYVREQRAMPLETAIHKMTGMSARRLRLEGRGTITPGAFADLVAFDPDTVADRATFANPHQYPVGIPHVMVNGQFVVRDGESTGVRSGRVVRPGVRV